MCGRYNLTSNKALQFLYDELGIEGFALEQNNIAPGMRASFIAHDVLAGQNSMMHGMWSLLIEARPNDAKGHPQKGVRPNPKYKTFNARYDRLASSPLWRDAFSQTRCLVPATGFYEWRDKEAYHLYPQNAEGQHSGLMFGGLYRQWQMFGERRHSFSIVTVPPHAKTKKLHYKSSPLVLRPDQFATWLTPGPLNEGEAKQILQPRFNERMYVDKVSDVKAPQDAEQAYWFHPDS